MTPAGLPHSDTPGSQLGCQLPRAYRRLQRPSSALDAKASTMCPSQLVSQTLNKNYKDTQPHHRHNQGSSRATTKNKRQQPKNLVVARCSRPLSTCQTPHPPTPKTHTHSTRPGKGGTEKTNPPHLSGATGLIPQGPTACQNPTPTGHHPGSTPTNHHSKGAAAQGSTEDR
jgi:hypothetical protein